MEYYGYNGLSQRIYRVDKSPLLNSGIVTTQWFYIRWFNLGCSIGASMLPFICTCIDPLLCRLATDVKGVNVFGHQVAVRAFVDDLVIFSSYDSDTMRSGEIINEYCHWTSQSPLGWEHGVNAWFGPYARIHPHLPPPWCVFFGLF